MEGDIAKDSDEDLIEVVELEDSRCNTQLHVSKKYLGLIIGENRDIISRIENDTKTELKVPDDGQGGKVIIHGSSAANVKAARRHLNTIVVSSRMKQRPTHFISIPMNKSDIMEKFTQFQDNVLRDCQSSGLDKSIFIKASKVHLTMGVLCLLDDEERNLASALLTQAKEKVVMPLLQERLPVKIKIKGLSHMNDNPKKIHVLYANVEEFESSPGLLQQLADGVVDYFNRKGFMKKEEFGRDSVKLHVTLINSKYRKRSPEDVGSKKRRSGRRRKPFDGFEILDKYSDFDFGVLELNEIHLSRRDATGSDGYYQPTFVISVP